MKRQRENEVKFIAVMPSSLAIAYKVTALRQFSGHPGLQTQKTWPNSIIQACIFFLDGTDSYSINQGFQPLLATKRWMKVGAQGLYESLNETKFKATALHSSIVWLPAMARGQYESLKETKFKVTKDLISLNRTPFSPQS